ncbi:hypothetical protein CC78DRAFT_578830 [Lojkania enalia]|uniref:Uncharacterized protein n=1 Tax=Lojkania enalia TaxID=147567 RepID=A0A9P4KC49_9PLEO|nr:hypothetical protein CC78DRAFT_578830 [Didymosphaeria enalia]
MLEIAAKTNWRKRRLVTLERKLNGAQKLIQTSLLIRICDRADVLSLDLSTLDQGRRQFIEKHRNGHMSSSDLISQEMLKTRAHVKGESTKTERSVWQDFTQEIGISEINLRTHIIMIVNDSTKSVRAGLNILRLGVDHQAKREHLLWSLKFLAMDERRNHIQRSHYRTFQ